MAQTTSEIWEKLRETRNTRREYKFEIDGAEYGPETVVSHTVSQELYTELSIGNAAAAKLTLEVAAENIPRAATVRRYARLVNGENASEWLQAGVYFINRRAEENGVWSIEAFDVIRKAEAVWEPAQELSFPMTMPQAARTLAELMGCELDDRTSLNETYTIDYPASGTTMRQELQYIAAAHGGNWVATGEGKLLLQPLGGEPPETHYLITEWGRAITLGEVRLLV